MIIEKIERPPTEVVAPNSWGTRIALDPTQWPVRLRGVHVLLRLPIADACDFGDLDLVAGRMMVVVADASPCEPTRSQATGRTKSAWRLCASPRKASEQRPLGDQDRVFRAARELQDPDVDWAHSG